MINWGLIFILLHQSFQGDVNIVKFRIIGIPFDELLILCQSSAKHQKSAPPFTATFRRSLAADDVLTRPDQLQTPASKNPAKRV